MHPSDHLPDDRKRSETMSLKVTERMREDLERVAESQSRSPSDLLYRHLRQYLYGEMVRLEALATQFPSGTEGKPR